jgi:hypothetical protein
MLKKEGKRKEEEIEAKERKKVQREEGIEKR